MYDLSALSRHSWLPAALVAALALTSCAQTKLAVHAIKKVVTSTAPAPAPTPAPPVMAEPTGKGVYKVGAPYQVDGVWYYPREDPFYDETGIASWYGEPFHGETTANGELYDMNGLTAAHKTLPMPSFVNVTNLENCRSLVVRVNDRGPFLHGRLIDVSRRTAGLLGFEDKGTARVRVRLVGTRLARTIAARPETSAEERGAVIAVPRVPVTSRRLVPAGQVVTASLTQTASLIVPGARPEVTLRAVRPTRLFVQAGAFSFHHNARRLGAKLSVIGPTEISSASVRGQQFFRVRIGPLDSLAMADATLERLIKGGFPGARIVVD